MSVRTLRWSGWLLLLGSVVYIVGSLLGLIVDFGPAATIAQIIFLVLGALLVLVGLPAFYRKQAKQVGRVGLCGFLALTLAEVLLGIVANIFFAVNAQTTGEAGSAQPSPVIFLIAFGGAALGLIGGLLFGIRTLRAQVFPPAIGWFLVVAGILSLAFLAPLPGEVGGTISEIALFLAFGWMGYLLAIRTTEGIVQAPA